MKPLWSHHFFVDDHNPPELLRVQKRGTPITMELRISNLRNDQSKRSAPVDVVQEAPHTALRERYTEIERYVYY